MLPADERLKTTFNAPTVLLTHTRRRPPDPRVVCEPLN